MKKFLLILFAMVLCHHSLYSQGCLASGITFSTQQQIDNFKVFYPGCTVILGSATISGADIVNLNGLDVLTAVKGTLSIGYNPVLISLAGLQMIDSIGNSLIINNNTILEGLSDLQSLKYIGYDFMIGNNPALTSIVTSGMLQSIYAELQINGNQNLSSLSGFDGLTSVGLLTIRNNNQLTSLSGLDNIDGYSIAALTIIDNPKLSTCNVKSICDFIESHPGGANIFNNAAGCNSQTEVEEACEFWGITENDNHRLVVQPNPNTGIVTIKTPGSSSKSQLSILNLSGQEISHYNLTDAISTIDLNGLPAGIYFCRISDGQRMETVKLALIK